MRRGRLLACGAATVGALAFAAAKAPANIDPAPGLDWLASRTIVLENAAEFPEWIFVVYPCTPIRGELVSLDPYCILREAVAGQPPQLAYVSTIHALPKSAFTVVFDPKGGVVGKGGWSITQPKIDDAAVFFERDPRVVRPGFDPGAAATIGTVPEHAGIGAATFYLRVDAVDDKGVKAHFTRVRYTCWSKDMVELPWDASRPGQLPLPDCPAVPVDSPTAPLPRLGAGPAVERDRRLSWVGLAVAGASLLLGGYLLKRDRAPAR